MKIGASFLPYAKALPDRVLAHLRLLDGDFGGFPVDRLTHCYPLIADSQPRCHSGRARLDDRCRVACLFLQTATRAHRDGRDEEYVVCALLHDIGDTLGSFNHPDIAAAILKPFVSEANHWMVAHHGIFQGYYFFHHIGMDRNMRDAFRAQPHFALTEEFCAKYDGPAFDAHAETLPLDHFEPMLRRVFAQPKNSIYRAAMK
jgi:predicted HD phosphohydrolase